MRRKMLKTVGILTLSFMLGIGMVGCAGKGDNEPDTPDIQGVTLHDNDEIGSNSETNLPDSQNPELNNDDSAGNGNGIKDGGEAESDNEAGNNTSVEGNMESVYFEGADLNGRVLEFSDTGFTITPIFREVFADGTSNSWEAAPGKENEEDNINVTYTEDTVFEIVYFNMSLQDVSSREEADKSSIKKQTIVYVFGSSEDGKNWTADKVLIQRWENN